MSANFVKKSIFFILLFLIFGIYFFLLFNYILNSLNLVVNFSLVKFEIFFISIIFSTIFFYLYFGIFKELHLKFILKFIYPFLILYIVLIFTAVNYKIINHRFSNPLGLFKQIFGLSIFLFGLVNFLNISFNINRLNLSFQKSRQIFLIALFIFYLIVGFWTTLDGDHGDEWVYRIMAQSFIKDFDFNLANNVDRKYWDNGVFAKLSEDKLFVKYYPLFPIMISPAFIIDKIIPETGIFMIFQKIGSPLVPFKISFLIRVIIILTAVINSFLVIEIIRYIFKIPINWFMVSIYFVLTPFSIYASQIYPEMFGAFFTTIFLIIYFSEKYDLNFKIYIKNIFLFLIPVILIWIHPRFMFASIIFYIMLFLKYNQQKKNILFIFNILFFLINIGLIYLYQKSIPSDQNLNFVIHNAVNNFFDFTRINENFRLTLIDKRQGLIFNFPIIFFLLLILKYYKFNEFYFTINLFLILFIIFMIFQSVIIGAGHASPPLRFFVFIFPLILANLYFLWYNINDRIMKKIYYLFLAAVFINSIVTLFYQRLRFENIFSKYLLK